MPKWLLLQMTRMDITCSKKSGDTFFFIINPSENVIERRKKYQNVGQMLPNLGFKAKEKTLTTCFVSY